MAILKQKKNDYATYIGWYGKCGETNCEQEFSLKDESRIYTVYSTPDGGFKTYIKGVLDFMNAVKTLECGKSYWMVLEPGEGEVDIPDFTVAEDSDNIPESTARLLINACSAGDGTTNPNPTPTPQQSDSTPTPVPSPAKKMKLPIILLGWDTGDTTTSLHFTSNPLLMGGESKRYATKSDVEAMFNGSNYSWPYAPDNTKPTGSANEYYKSISFNQLDLEFEVLPAGTDPDPTSNNLNDFAYLIDEDYRECGHGKANRSYNKLRSYLAQKVFPQVLENLKKRGRDFYEDFWAGVPLTIIQAGFSASGISNNRNDFIWAHKFQFKFSGRQQLYNINPFLGKMTSRGDLDRATISPVGVIIHETLHAFGLPDLYDTSYKGSGINKVAVMSSGSYGNAISSVPQLPSFAISWSRNLLSNEKKLFDTEVVNIESSMSDLEIYPANDVNKLYKIHHPTESDVWWIEYRTSESTGKVVNFDKLISENGLAIIHESTSGGSKTNKYKQPTHRRGESGYFISIEQRDGKYDTQAGSRNISNDLYQEGHEFSPYTTPSSVSRSGVPSGIKIHNIRKTDNGSMLVDVEFISEPSGKIVSIDYSWADTSKSLTSSYRAIWTESSSYGSLSATIKTENIPDGTTIDMQVNPGVVSDVAFSGQVNGNECVINFQGSALDALTRESSKGTTNHIRYSAATDGNHADTFPWIDYVVVKP
jgi:M6 family metalloprotease-like protein